MISFGERLRFTYSECGKFHRNNNKHRVSALSECESKTVYEKKILKRNMASTKAALT